jgi:hypothetical protein
MAHSLLVAPLEMELAAFFLAFGRLEAGGMRREGEGMSHSLLVAPLEMELAALFLGFVWLEAGGMRREGEGMGREEQGMRREEVFAGHEAPSE